MCFDSLAFMRPKLYVQYVGTTILLLFGKGNEWSSSISYSQTWWWEHNAMGLVCFFIQECSL